MKQGEENFEVVKDSDDNKKNYIFKKDGITTKTFIFVAVVLVILIVAVALTSRYLG